MSARLSGYCAGGAPVGDVISMRPARRPVLVGQATRVTDQQEVIEAVHDVLAVLDLWPAYPMLYVHDADVLAGAIVMASACPFMRVDPSDLPVDPTDDAIVGACFTRGYFASLFAPAAKVLAPGKPGEEFSEAIFADLHAFGFVQAVLEPADGVEQTYICALGYAIPQHTEPGEVFCTVEAAAMMAHDFFTSSAKTRKISSCEKKIHRIHEALVGYAHPMVHEFIGCFVQSVLSERGALNDGKGDGAGGKS